MLTGFLELVDFKLAPASSASTFKLIELSVIVWFDVMTPILPKCIWKNFSILSPVITVGGLGKVINNTPDGFVAMKSVFIPNYLVFYRH